MNRSEEDCGDIIFNQIQECGDIISSILLICKFITENGIPIEFNVDRLRSIALRAVDTETCTSLWHVNALIAASGDLEHLLLGIEMMFERFLGNKHLFVKEKEKEKVTISSDLTKSISKNKYIGNEIVSFVQSYYEPNDTNDADHRVTKSPQTPSINIGKKDKRFEVKINDENENTNAMREYDENRDYMNKYRGKISSPISFRMRQQKRMVQRGRSNSRNAPIDFDYSPVEPPQRAKQLEPQVTSPFNISKFAQRVDRTT